jgi:hypothetical protein
VNIAEATVTVPYQTLRNMEDAIAAFKLDQTRFDEMLKEAMLKGADGAAQAYREAFFVLFRIVQYSLAHLDPMTFRGWPHVDVKALSELLKTLPYLTEEIREISTDLGIYAKEGKKWEDARTAGTEQQMLAEDNARRNGAMVSDEGATS